MPPQVRRTGDKMKVHSVWSQFVLNYLSYVTLYISKELRLLHSGLELWLGIQKGPITTTLCKYPSLTQSEYYFIG